MLNLNNQITIYIFAIEKKTLLKSGYILGYLVLS